MAFKQLKTSDLARVRAELSEAQGGICPLCGKPLDNPVLDHQHRLRKSQEIGDDGAGLVRGVLCRDCNVLEGKIWNATNRYLRPETKQERIEFLRNLVKYLEKVPTDMIHSTERPREPILSKRQYNKLVKLAQIQGVKVPEYPRSKHLTKRLKVLFERFDINPFN